MVKLNHSTNVIITFNKPIHLRVHNQYGWTLEYEEAVANERGRTLHRPSTLTSLSSIDETYLQSILHL